MNQNISTFNDLQNILQIANWPLITSQKVCVFFAKENLENQEIKDIIIGLTKDIEAERKKHRIEVSIKLLTAEDIAQEIEAYTLPAINLMIKRSQIVPIVINENDSKNFEMKKINADEFITKFV